MKGRFNLVNTELVPTVGDVLIVQRPRIVGMVPKCPKCAGTGIDQEWGTDSNPEPKCKRCDGTGEDEDYA